MAIHTMTDLATLDLFVQIATLKHQHIKQEIGGTEEQLGKEIR